jgi:MFS family permease
VFIQNAFVTATSDLALLGMFLVAGLLVGAVSYGRFGSSLNKGKVIFASLALSGMGIVMFTALVSKLGSFSMASVSSFVIGLFVSPIVVSSNTLVHEVFPEEARGRVFSSIEAIIHVGFLVFMLLASFLAEHIGRMWILFFVGSTFSAFGVVGIVVMLRRR